MRWALPYGVCYGFLNHPRPLFIKLLMKTTFRTLALIFCLAFAGFAAEPAPDTVLEYVQARAQQENIPYTVDVTISASIPSMGKLGTLRATRHQGGHGKLNYEAMRFEGDSMVKTSVIARYLTAELESQRPEQRLATEISPNNYEFKLKGRDKVDGREALIYEVKPLKKRHGLFKGQIWIDAETRQPLKETGKLAKLPSVWVKEISFTREYSQTDGYAMPAKITSEVKTRIVGKAQISVEFANYRFSGPSPVQQTASTVALDGQDQQ